MAVQALFSAIFILTVLCNVQGLTGPFTTTISTPPQIKVGQDVTCKVTITNNHNRDYQLLKRETPLDGLKSHIFSVTIDEREVSYEGPHYRRAPPTESDYIIIPAKSSMAAAADLSLVYGFRTPGEYSVQFTTILKYFSDNLKNSSTQLVSSNIQLFTLMESTKRPKLTKAEAACSNSTANSLGLSPQRETASGPISPHYAGTGTASDRATGKIAYTSAYNMLGKSASSVTSNPTLYTRWFGKGKTGSSNKVKNNYLAIKSAMETQTYTLYFHGLECTGDAYAYTYYNCPIVYFCYVYFISPLTGIDSKADTIIHEMSHTVAHTKDIAYGTQGCLHLAKKHPSKAIKNADNYGYFADEAQ